jgi:predicted small lipoprotein YifL
MHRLALPPVLLVVAALAGCGGGGAALPPVTAAPPQQARVEWVEPTSTKPDAQRLVFLVKRIEIGRDGWKVDVGIRNETAAAWQLGGPQATSVVPFGVMLFATGNHAELEERTQSGELPGTRDAHAAFPDYPEVLDPGRTWEGTISAPGALAAGRWLRVVFGPMFAQGDAPSGLPHEFVWITDNAYQLQR